jgi:hypothetical protein
VESDPRRLVGLLDLPPILRRIVAAEVVKARRTLEESTDDLDGPAVALADMASSPLHRMSASLESRKIDVKAIAISDDPVLGDVFEVEMTRVASNASLQQLMDAIRSAVCAQAWGDDNGQGFLGR